MEKTINIGGEEVKLNNNVGWLIAYKDQFGVDIVQTLMPMMAGALDVVTGIVNEIGKPDEISLDDVVKIMDGDYLINALIHLGSLEFVDFINIVWALAKAADGSIPEPKKWVQRFESFPLDEIAPQIFDLVATGVVSSKKLMRLKEMILSLQPKNSTSKQSSSLESNED